jgi:hypothetical protein
MPKQLCKTILIFFFSSFMIFYPKVTLAWDTLLFEKDRYQVAQQDESIQNSKDELTTDISVSPSEIDFGDICHVESVTKTFSLKKLGNGSVKWAVTEIEDWTFPARASVNGIMELDDVSHKIKVTLKCLGNDTKSENSNGNHIVQLQLESGNKVVFCQKEFSTGTYKQCIQLNLEGHIKTVSMDFLISPLEDLSPRINIEPLRMDFGIIKAGEKAVKRVKLTNNGKTLLKWSASVAKSRNGDQKNQKQQGRYQSFFNDEKKNSQPHMADIQHKSDTTLSGTYTLLNGHPHLSEGTQTLRYQFSGGNIDLFFYPDSNEGNLQFYIDDVLIYNYYILLIKKEISGTLAVKDLPEGSHVLTLVPVNGQFIIEGVHLFDRDVIKESANWITIFPDSGTTLTEHDYVNIQINPQTLKHGFYAENILFKSNGGEIEAEISMEVAAPETSKIRDVYRYLRKYDYLYTTDPAEDFKSSKLKGYIKEGIAFRLFTPGAPGTTEFYRWFNPQKGDHYYSYNMNLDRKRFGGYIFEGTIGNIATSRLTGTKPLYRWYHPKTGCHFYTTKEDGEKISSKGYIFEGIAGYVK